MVYKQFGAARDRQVTVSRAVMLTVVLSALQISAVFCGDPLGPSQHSDEAQIAPPADGATTPQPAGSGYYAVELVREVDPGDQELVGLKFSAGAVDEPTEYSDGRAESSLTALLGDNQHVYRASLDVGLSLFAVKSAIVIPRIGLGLEYRGSPPQAGVGGVFSVGVEVATWIKKRAQVAFFVDRTFGFPSGTRNQFGFAIRWVAKRLPWWPRDKTTMPGKEPTKP